MDTASTSASEPTHDPALLFPLDIEHAGIRLALPAILIGSGVLAFFLISPLVAAVSADGSTSCLALLIAGAVAIFATGIADRVLKRRWPSRRALRIDEQTVTLLDSRRGRARELAIHWGQRVNVLAWRFTVKRSSSRVQRGWSMLALQIAQDDTQFAVYAFFPPKEADAVHWEPFKQLVPRSVVDKGELPLRETNQLRRLLRAEDERWMEGAEMRREDFVAFLETLTGKVPNWHEQMVR